MANSASLHLSLDVRRHLSNSLSLIHKMEASTSNRTSLLSKIEGVKNISNFKMKKILFLLANVICALISFIFFSQSLYYIYSVKSNENIPIKFPLCITIMYALTIIVNLFGCFAVVGKSVRIMRLFYFFMWIILAMQIAFFAYFLIPMSECDPFVRKFREIIAELTFVLIGVAVFQVSSFI